MEYKPAIVVIGYNRPKQIKRLLESIGQAKYPSNDITLIVSIDQSDLSDEVEQEAINFVWRYGNKIIRRFPKRQGLRNHIIQCGDLSDEYDSVIILEDDLYVAEDYYLYAANAHKFYSDNSNICGISLYNFERNQFTNYQFRPEASKYDTYLGQMVVTWGQSWTKAQWKAFKNWYTIHEEKLPEHNYSIPDEISSWKRSWGKYFASYIAEKDLFYVYPYRSRTTCFSDIGEHNVKVNGTAVSQVSLMCGLPAYNFAPMNTIIKYDPFYERILSNKNTICGIQGDDISLDLNGMKRSSKGKKYIITSKQICEKQICSFGIAMRPIEENIIHCVPGQEFILYELSNPCDVFFAKKKKNYKYVHSYDRLRYEHNDLGRRILVFYTFREIMSSLSNKIMHLLKGKKMFKH